MAKHRKMSQTVTAEERANAIGRVVWKYYQGRASEAVCAAITKGTIPPLADTICKYCGAPAAIYEHRDYAKPLDVVPACDTCNHTIDAAALDPYIVIAHIVTGVTFGMAKTAHAAELGSIRTAKKATSSRANGLKGGRPITRCPHGLQPSRCKACR